MCRTSRKFKPMGLLWQNLLSSIIALVVCRLDAVHGVFRGRLMIPPVYSAMGSDLRVQLHTAIASPTYTNNYQSVVHDLRLQISRFDETQSRVAVGSVDVYPDPRSNVTQITIPCQNFLRGGQYELEIVGNDINSSIDNHDERLQQQLDVRWPVPKLSVTPESIGTYPQEPVIAILEFPGVECLFPNNESPDVPEFWIELLFCGHEVYCDANNVTKSQILYAEQVRGFPKTRIVKLGCELFGLAGHYVLKLRPSPPIPSVISATAYIRADWSEQFVFNVHARSIFPCDPHTGIGVLFEYPPCILDQADRVRLFAKLRADVASLAPPTSLHYVTEQRVIRTQHSLHFDCELFSEKYVEYCFVYVSQAISGAVADVRMDCVPTLPVSDSDTGGWGPWSDWTPCSTTCAGGTKNRYRFCDSPPPRYGAKFCEGSAVETDRCGGPDSGTWECLYGNSNSLSGEVPADRPEVLAEIGLGCRCGCIVHLGVVKPRKLIASSSHSCPGRTFWLIQADTGQRIRFKLDFFRLPCSSQWLKIRDGDSLADNLIAEYIGGNEHYPDAIISIGSQILLEFFSDELASMGESCGGGFLGHAQQLYSPQDRNITAPISIPSKAIMPVAIASAAIRLTIIHVAAIVFVSLIIVISALLGAQYVFRYRKYQLAESVGEPDSPAHTPHASLNSLPVGNDNDGNTGSGPPSRAVSTSTLISEVISLVKLRPRVNRKPKHSRLRESVDIETMERTTSNSCNDDVEKSKSDADDDISLVSSHTLTNETLNDLDNPMRRQKKITTPNSNERLSDQSGYSPPSNNSISLPPTPHDTPMPARRSSATSAMALREKYSSSPASSHASSYAGCSASPCSSSAAITGSETRSMNGGGIRRKKKLSDVSPLHEEDDTETDTDSLRMGTRRTKMLSVSNAALTNGCYSPASSMTSTATIRTTNQKESKEKKNRERLLAGPGSEFSLVNPEDLEMDYYDYNVINAGAAPGSYLGMDPAYLVWIPPIDEGSIFSIDDNEPHYEEILPRNETIDPGSNTETPEEEAPQLPPVKPARKIIHDTDNIKNNLITKGLAASVLKEEIPKLNTTRRGSSTSNTSGVLNKSNIDGIPLQEFPNKSNKFSSPAKRHSKCDNETEKETAVVKSPSDNINDYYELDDIQFADDDEDDDNDHDVNEDSAQNSTIAINKTATVKRNYPTSSDLTNKYHVKT